MISPEEKLNKIFNERRMCGILLANILDNQANGASLTAAATPLFAEWKIY